MTEMITYMPHSSSYGIQFSYNSTFLKQIKISDSHLVVPCWNTIQILRKWWRVGCVCYFRIAEFQSFRFSEFQNVRISESKNFRISKFWIFECSHLQISFEYCECEWDVYKDKEDTFAILFEKTGERIEFEYLRIFDKYSNIRIREYYSNSAK